MLPEHVRVETGNGGLERIIIDRASCFAELYLHGATLTAWRPKDHAPVLWVSREAVFRDDKPIRGGVPICFPWFGPRPGHVQHGFARVSPWRLEGITEAADTGAIHCILTLEDSDQTRQVFPHRFVARYEVIAGEKLELRFSVTNRGEESFEYEEALHTYFAVSDVRQVTVSGLEGARYIDKLRDGAIDVEPDAPITFTRETDRLHPGTTASCELSDPGLARRISVQKDGSRSTVVWNPWIDKARSMSDFGDDEWTSMVCIEPANAGGDAITLAPGETHELRVKIVANALISG